MDGGLKTSNIKIRIRDNWRITSSRDQLSCDLDGEAVLLHLQSGVYFGLEGVGNAVWELIREPKSLDEICDRLQDEYETTREDCEEAVSGFLEDLVLNGLADLQPGD